MYSSKQPVDNEPVAGAGQPDRARVARRRALLGAISAAGVAGAVQLPQQWTRPVVDHVVLPAHGQLSPVATQTVTCDLSCSFGAEYEIEFASTCGTFFIFDVSYIGFTDCVSEPGGDVSRTSFLSNSFTSSGTASDTETLAASTLFGTFDQTGICEEPVA
jgi:hypothetical protein